MRMNQYIEVIRLTESIKTLDEHERYLIDPSAEVELLTYRL